MTTLAGYGTWASPLTADAITAGQVGLAQPSLDRGCSYWLEARPQEAGRTVLVRRPPQGARTDLTPAPFNVRTRVHEYGGGAYAVKDGVIVAANFADQRLYRIEQGAAPQPLTPESEGRLRYADLEPDLGRRRVLAVREDHRTKGEAANTVVAVDLAGGDDGRVLIAGHDFFSSPRLSPDGDRLAWLSWDHPNMPWDGTRLWSAEIAADGGLREVREVAGGDRDAIVQPAWSPDGRLYFVSDRSGWWNLYWAEDGAVRAVLPMSAEFAGPAWAFGMRWYGFLGPSTILACFSEDGRWHLGIIDVAAGALERLELSYTELAGIAVEDGQAILRAGRPDAPAAIVLLDPASRRVRELATAGELPVDPAYLSVPESITWPSENGAFAHTFYYPPANPDFGRLPARRRRSSSRAMAGRPAASRRSSGCRPSSGPLAGSPCATSTTAAARAMGAPIARGLTAAGARSTSRTAWLPPARSWPMPGRTPAVSRSPAAAPAATRRSAR